MVPDGGAYRHRRLLATVARAAAAMVVVVAAVAVFAWPGAATAASETGGSERLARALLLAQKGDWPGARDLADGLGEPQLRSYFLWRELLESRDRPPFAAYDAFFRHGAD